MAEIEVLNSSIPRLPSHPQSIPSHPHAQLLPAQAPSTSPLRAPAVLMSHPPGAHPWQPSSNEPSSSSAHHLHPSDPQQTQSHPGQQQQLEPLVQNLRAVYRAYHLDWIEHCEAIDRLRLRLSRKKRPTLTPVTSSVDLSIGLPLTDPGSLLSGSSNSTGIASLTAGGRTTRRTANFSTFGIGDAVTDAQFDLVLAQLGTADQKDPNIRAMKTTAHVPDMALFLQDRILSISDDQDTLVTDPIRFYQLDKPQTTDPSTSSEPDHTRHRTSAWTEEEQDTFEKSYAAQPKQFGWIASQLGSKTRAECVLHYYRTKRENKYRNLHSLPQPINEGKNRELRGKRSRKAPCKTSNDPTPLPTLKPKLKPTPDNAQPTGDEADEQSIEPTPTPVLSVHQPNPKPTTDLDHQASPLDEDSHEPRSNPDPLPPPSTNQSSQIGTSHETFQPNRHPLHSSTPPDSNRDRSVLNSPKSTIDPLETRAINIDSQLNHPTSTHSPRSDLEPAPTTDHGGISPFQSTSRFDPSHRASSPLASLGSHPSKANRASFDSTSNSPSWAPRAYKKRKVQSIDTSDHELLSRGVSSTEETASSSTAKVSPAVESSTPDLGVYHPTGSTKLSERSHPTGVLPPSDHSNDFNARLDQDLSPTESKTIHQSVSKLITEQPSAESNLGSEVALTVAEISQSTGTSSLPHGESNSSEAPVIRSSMQIKNLLNDDPVEPCTSLSNMDASAWFGTGSQQPSPTDEVLQADISPVEEKMERPSLSIPPLGRILLPTTSNDPLHPTVTQRPLSQPLSQSIQSLPPQPLSRPLSRPSIHANLTHSPRSTLPPLSFHRPNPHPPELRASVDRFDRHTDGTVFDGDFVDPASRHPADVMVVDERFADPPSSPISSSVGQRAAMNSSRGYHEPPLAHESVKSIPSLLRGALPHQIKYGRGSFSVQDRSNLSDYRPTAGPSPPQLHMSPHAHLQSHSQIPSQPLHPRPASQASRPQLPSQSHPHLVSHPSHPSHMTPPSTHSHIPSHYPHPTSQGSPRLISSSQLRSPNSSVALRGGPSHFSPTHSPVPSPFNRLPPSLPSSSTTSGSSHNKRPSSDATQRPPSHHHHHIWSSSHHGVNNHQPNYSIPHPTDRLPSSTVHWIQNPPSHPSSSSPHPHSHPHPHHHHHHLPTSSINYHPHFNHHPHYSRHPSLTSQVSHLPPQDHPPPMDTHPISSSSTNHSLPPPHLRHPNNSNPAHHHHHHHHHRSSSASSINVDWDHKER